MPEPEKIEHHCTKEHPYDGSKLKENEVWMHNDAYDTNPEWDGEIVTYHCPNCGMNIIVDFR